MTKRNQLALLLLLTIVAPLGAATRNNDDACDIGLFPAATLLLPYFEVALDSAGGESTIFTVTNTTAQPQAARVTLWTDWAYPVLSFNLFLTGYDVQKINLYDVIVRGQIAPDAEMGSDSSPVGELSGDDNPRLDEPSCVSLPQAIPAIYLQLLQSALTLGKVPALGSSGACNTAGGKHQNAIGYATIDVVGACTASLPTDASYFTHEIRFDNVLIGDSIQINNEQNYAQGDPMVHIRAIPEGGEVSTRKNTNLARTFYSRLQPAATRTLDARQPLPATFAARWISGGATAFETYFKIWRESTATSRTACSAYQAASERTYEVVRFDEDENPEVIPPPPLGLPFGFEPLLPATSLTDSASADHYPPVTTPAVGGWMYLNLHNGASDTIASQNWVVVSMRAEGRFSVDVDATALGNGCSAIRPLSEAYDGSAVIGPAPNDN